MAADRVFLSSDKSWVLAGREAILKGVGMGESYTFDELRAMGCPDSLLMQYIGWSKEEIDKLVSENQPQQASEGKPE